jgi:hypothetical protein
MINALFRKKANTLQQWCVDLCVERYKCIGTTIFLRCLSCHKIVTAEKITQDGRCWCNGRRFKETNLTILEEMYWIGRAIIWKIRKKS